jgi:hypothetical protein
MGGRLARISKGYAERFARNGPKTPSCDVPSCAARDTAAAIDAAPIARSDVMNRFRGVDAPREWPRRPHFTFSKSGRRPVHST